MRTTIISLLFASLVFTGCAAQSGAEGEDEFVASEAEALTAAELYKAQVGDYSSKGNRNVTYTLNADRTFLLDTGLRCITTPCPSSDSGTWTLYAYKKNVYLNLAGKAASRWFHVSSLGPVTHVGISGVKGTFTKNEVLTGPGCAATTCAIGTICVEEGGEAQCISQCATVRCTADSYCDASDGTAGCEKFTCPKQATVNCMPIVSESVAKYCSGNYHEWIKKNCKTEFVY